LTVDVLGEKFDVLVIDVLEIDVLEIVQMGRLGLKHLFWYQPQVKKPLFR
jgi:hypothetical protein